jgi:hypothetical protein
MTTNRRPNPTEILTALEADGLLRVVQLSDLREFPARGMAPERHLCGLCRCRKSNDGDEPNSVDESCEMSTCPCHLPWVEFQRIRTTAFGSRKTVVTYKRDGMTKVVVV